MVRHLLIASHYRSPINYSEDSLKLSVSALERFYIALKDLNIDNAKMLTNSRFEKAFFEAMDDDFNTPEAFSVLFSMVTEINKQKIQNPDQASQLGALLVRLGAILGVLQLAPESFLKGDIEAVDAELIESLIVARKQARSNKDWGKADELRDKLTAMSVVVEDGADGSSWRIER